MTPAVPATQDQATLAGLLAQELATLRSFVALLRHEQSLLGQGAAEQLAVLAPKKSSQAAELAGLAAARERALADLNLPAGRKGMDAWVEAGGGSRNEWTQLLELAAEARAINETNGKLIALHLRHNQQALGALMTAVDQTVTYGPDGQQQAGGGGRSFGSA